MRARSRTTGSKGQSKRMRSAGHNLRAAEMIGCQITRATVFHRAAVFGDQFPTQIIREYRGGSSTNGLGDPAPVPIIGVSRAHPRDGTARHFVLAVVDVGVTLSVGRQVSRRVIHGRKRKPVGRLIERRYRLESRRTCGSRK